MDIQKIDFFYENRAIEEASFFLVSSPTIEDDWFSDTVILVYSYEEGITEGFIINRRHVLTLSEINPLVREHIPVYSGGPIYPETGILLHNDKNLGDVIEIADDLYITEEIENIHWDKISSNSFKYRLIFGFSSWSNGQLQEELDSKQWFKTYYDMESIFCCDDQMSDLWGKQLEKMGKKYEILKNYSKNAFLN